MDLYGFLIHNSQFGISLFCTWSSRSEFRDLESTFSHRSDQQGCWKQETHQLYDISLLTIKFWLVRERICMIRLIVINYLKTVCFCHLLWNLNKSGVVIPPHFANNGCILVTTPTCSRDSMRTIQWVIATGGYTFLILLSPNCNHSYFA